MQCAWANTFNSYACHKLEQNMRQIARCARLLDRDELWRRDNEHCNAVGNLILHLAGNVGQWIIEGVGGEPYQRDRAAEFAQREPLDSRPIIERLGETVEQAGKIIRLCGPNRLESGCVVQGYEVTILEAIFHVVEHFSLHTGQIVHITKAIKNVDLSIYDSDGQSQDDDSAGSP